jgi:ABC-2 type transport system ATP-binding protein
VIDHGLVIAEGEPDELKAQVGGDRLEIRLEQSEHGNDAIAALSVLADGQPSLADGTLRVPLSSRRGAIAAAVRRLDEAGIAIDDGPRRSTMSFSS